MYDQYYGVGVNGTLAELSGDRKQTHGLLIDKPGDGLPTAMAWKAPESGTRHAVAQDVRRQDR